MKMAGFLLLLSGWFLVLAAVVLLRASGPQAVFVLAGIAVEILAFVLLFRAHRIARGRPE